MKNKKSWTDLKKRLVIGQVVDAVVLEVHVFGIIVDIIGEVYSGLITLPYMGFAPGDREVEFPTKGTRISARVIGFREPIDETRPTDENQVWLELVDSIPKL